MLKYLKIRNVQSHRKTVLRFSPKVNMIFGISQYGKTAIFRAVRSLLTNRPLGLSLKSDFSKKREPMVISMANDFGVVTLTKSDKTSEYTVKGNGKKASFRKFKSSVPSMVKKALPIDFDLSFQDQLHPYLVFESPTDLGKRIDSVIGTEELEKWMAKTSKVLSRKKGEVKNLKVSIEEDKKKLLGYEGIDDLRKDVEGCLALETKISKVKTKIRDIEVFRLYRSKIKQSVSDLSGVQKLLDAIDGLIKDRQKLRRLDNEKETLKAFLFVSSTIKKLKKNIVSLKTKYGEVLMSKKRCPFCFSKISKKHVQMMLRNP